MYKNALLLAAVLASPSLPAPAAIDKLVRLFQNDPGHTTTLAIEERSAGAGVRISNISFASPVAGRTPGVLLTPAKRQAGRVPLLLFGHWMMQGSPKKNHTEFLEEAMIYARAGAVCLLLDTPLVRAGVVEDPDPMHGQEPNAALQMTREWRMALDLLLRRDDVDPSRVAYIGHSFSAGVGAKLMGVEKRIQSFVLMANTYSLRDYIFDQQDPEIIAMRNRMGEESVRKYLDQFAWEDPAPFVSHPANPAAAVLIQNGRTDKELPERVVRNSVRYFAVQSKQIEFYDAGHELNAAARLDRAKWLQRRLRLKTLDLHQLESIEPLH